MFDGILDDRLQNKFRYVKTFQRFFLDLHRKPQPIAKSHFLDLQIGFHHFQLIFNGIKIIAGLSAGGVAEEFGKQQRHFLRLVGILVYEAGNAVQ
ncbi:hypothetical protein D3C87_1993960 [compost metagenome]